MKVGQIIYIKEHQYPGIHPIMQAISGGVLVSGLAEPGMTRVQ